MILQAADRVTSFLKSIPQGQWICGRPELYQVVLYYISAAAVMTVMKFCLMRKTEQKDDTLRGTGAEHRTGKRSALMILCTIPFLLFMLFWRSAPEFSLAMLDVGQGDALVIRRGDHCYLADGGSSSVPSVGKSRLIPYLCSQGISVINGIFVSHDDADHINGLTELMEEQKENRAVPAVERLFLPCWMRESEEEGAALLRKTAEEAGIPVYYLQAGDTISDSGMTIRVLHPLGEGGIREGNSGSMVLDVSWEGFDALLTGDLETDGEEDILPLSKKYEYYKVSHHGSKNGSSEELLEQAQPVISAVSAPEDSLYGHPHREVLERLEKAGSDIYITRDCGCITVTVSDGCFRVQTFKNP